MNRLVNDLLWNRTATITGDMGKNIALDLLNEFENNEFKSKYVNNSNNNLHTVGFITISRNKYVICLSRVSPESYTTILPNFSRRI